MNKSILGVIDATTSNVSLEPLLTHRSLAAVPFGGRYRLIDFILSNMVNSGIHSVAIFPKYQYRSLMDHLGSGKNWDLNRKRDGLFFFPSPSFEAELSGIGAFNHFSHHIDYFERSKQEYAVISNCFTVNTMNFQPALEKHIQLGSDITELRHHAKSLQMYILKTSLLIDLIKTRKRTDFTCMRDVVESSTHNYKISRYEVPGFAKMIDSIECYYDMSLSLLDPSTWKELFMKDYPIYTKVKDEPPTRYSNGAVVKNSMVANGCVIEGHVENSIIFRGVKIGKGAVIKNSIIMQKSTIGSNCSLDAVILDKDVKVESGVSLIGKHDHPLVLQKGSTQGALMSS
ncbi:GlgC family sugar phosphate nucleotidyltransferase [Falsibacillus albus]|uniref:Glucose-1-phosphate adenylyltransferase n=1 Tax=Falsibacillus albus TaxID=2478915 RepID=A0A3L7K5A3_9BACI|nr:sugar phosphate nucleotidyltransferase [Falsibacillus albus]RLQ97835.1 glucose-1-phosphate adenylyltransferase [Falsibacillus albus]